MEASVTLLSAYTGESPSDADEISAESPSSKRGTAVSAIIILGVLAIIIGAIIGVMANHPPEEKTPFVRTNESIKAVCAVTQDPDSCFTEISSVDSGHVVDPEMIFDLTLKLAVNELANISSLPETLISRSVDLGTDSALRECASLFQDAVSQLTRSVESIREGEKRLLTEEKVAELMTWIGTAMTDQEKCVDGLEEMGSTAVDEVKLKMQRSNVCMSNSLAILANMEAILEQFGLRLH